MNIKIQSENLMHTNARAIVFFLAKEIKELPSSLSKLNKACKLNFHTLKKEQNFKADKGKALIIPTNQTLKARYIIIVGLGDSKNIELDTFRQAGADCLNELKNLKINSALIATENIIIKKIALAQIIQAISEGLMLKDYNFNKYLSKQDKQLIKNIFINVTSPNKTTAQAALTNAQILTQAQNYTRELVNEPGNVINPLKLVEFASDLAKEYQLYLQIYDEKQIADMGMNAFLAVAKGSTNKPHLIILTHKSTKAKQTVALVGKGLTFDSGGLNIKQGEFMKTMKMDKAGACTVLGIFKAIGEFKPDINVIGVIAACENMPDGNAYHPDDIIKAYNGTTIEIGNTDAEGRLTLADALSYTCAELKPNIIVDIATLTGACVVALGEYTAGIMGNNKKLIDRIVNSAQISGESIWPLPFSDLLRDTLKSPVADVSNIASSKYGGAITAGLFLEKFVKPSVAWAHLDIAGPAFSSKEWYYHNKGATGFAVRTIVNCLISLSQKK